LIDEKVISKELIGLKLKVVDGLVICSIEI
jgi:hypothetical protein